MDFTPDIWYRQLSIQFEDGTTEILHIERKPTGTHIPLLREKPQPWTRLTFHKCPGCPLTDNLPTCPAAISLQTTMSKLRKRKSFERVKAVAIDAQGRSQTVEWDLQGVGATLVQLAVFASSCPVGRRLKPYLVGLPPFVSSLDFSRHITSAILQKHGGSIEASRQEISEVLTPLHEVFVHLMQRLRADEAGDVRTAAEIMESPRDAVPNSINQVDSIAQHFSMRADRLLSEISAELGWSGAAAPAPPPKKAGVWQWLLDVFS